MQVPPNTKKIVLDAVDGYHSVILDEVRSPNCSQLLSRSGGGLCTLGCLKATWHLVMHTPVDMMKL